VGVLSQHYRRIERRLMLLTVMTVALPCHFGVVCRRTRRVDCQVSPGQYNPSVLRCADRNSSAPETISLSYVATRVATVEFDLYLAYRTIRSRNVAAAALVTAESVACSAAASQSIPAFSLRSAYAAPTQWRSRSNSREFLLIGCFAHTPLYAGSA
jgi:hypothetical protein